MLILQDAQSKIATRHGSHAAVLAELQADPAAPKVPTGTYRQCLLTLAERLARVQALGNECARVSFSPEAEAQVRAMTA